MMVKLGLHTLKQVLTQQLDQLLSYILQNGKKSDATAPKDAELSTNEAVNGDTQNTADTNKCVHIQ